MLKLNPLYLPIICSTYGSLFPISISTALIVTIFYFNLSVSSTVIFLVGGAMLSQSLLGYSPETGLYCKVLDLWRAEFLKLVPRLLPPIYEFKDDSFDGLPSLSLSCLRIWRPFLLSLLPPWDLGLSFKETAPCLFGEAWISKLRVVIWLPALI